MLTIKIPSPAIAKIIDHANSAHRDLAEVVDDYMVIVSNAISTATGQQLYFKDAHASDDGIQATINVRRLPNYQATANFFKGLNFEGMVITNINKANHHYGQYCPRANPQALQQPITLWPAKWITIYLWALICSASTHNQALRSDAEVMQLLMDQLINNTDIAKQHFTPDDAIELASTVVNGGDISTLIKNIINEATDLNCRVQTLDYNQVVTERNKINKTASDKIMLLIGDLLSTIKHDDDFFKNDTYYD